MVYPSTNSDNFSEMVEKLHIGVQLFPVLPVRVKDTNGKENVMETKMTATELAEKCRRLALDYKTLYILGCFGAPMNAQNRKRYTTNRSYNQQPERAAKILAAGEDTFGFDCVCMIKGLLWGWRGDSARVYGGAQYAVNGVPDIGADTMFQKCTEISTDFSCLEVGEAVWRSGHIGIYIGDGLAVEATPMWADGVQITACNRPKAGYPTRTWTKHGKLPYVRYGDCGLSWLRQMVELVTEGRELPVVSQQENRVHILVWLAQKRLHAMGYAVGEVDGIFGPATRAGVEAYQASRGIPVTGKLDLRTWQHLLEQEQSGE